MQYGNPVSWSDYSGVDGFGHASQQDVDELNKALTVGNSQNPPNSVVAGDGFALRVESLESTLKNTTFKMDNIVLWKTIPKLPAYNTVEEYNEISSYGQNPDSGFFSEGGLPSADDSTYQRRFAVVKFLGTQRAVSHVASLIKPAHGDVIAQETVAGTMHLLRMMERALIYGDSALSSVQFDGFEKLIKTNSPTTNIIDLRGASLSEDNLTDAALTIQDAPNYGTPTHMMTSPKVKADLVKTFFPKERYDLMSKPADGKVGLDISGFTSPAGDVAFLPDVFVTDGGAPPAAAVGDASKIPGTPVISTGQSAASSDATAQFTSADAGTYLYSVVACNQYGKSIAVVVSASPLSVVAGKKVTFGVTPSGSPTTEWYEVYRTTLNGAAGTKRLIQRIANTNTTGEQVITDKNATLPGCSIGIMFQMNLEALSFKQLAPMVKIPLAIVDTNIKWLQIIYGTPVLYTPGKIVLFQNIGRSANYVGAP